MESDKFLVGLFLPEGAERCRDSNADRKRLNAAYQMFLFSAEREFLISQPGVGVNLPLNLCDVAARHPLYFT